METCIGHVKHYYNHLGVAVLSLSQELQIDQVVHIYGHNTDLYQKAWSLEIDHHKVQFACPGTDVALKVADPVHEGDSIFLVEEISPEEKREIMLDQLFEKEGP
jgi:hypothetical protein